MKRKIFAALAVLVMLFSLCLTVSAAAQPRLADQAGLLTAKEQDRILSALNQASGDLKFDIVIATVDRLGGMDVSDFAQQYYEQGGFRADGVLLVIAMAERKWDLSCYGYGEIAFDAAAREYIGGRLVSNMTDGDFYQVFADYIELSRSFVEQARAGQPYGKGNLPKGPLPGWALPVAILIGLVIGGITVAVMRGKLKSVRQASRAAEYIEPGSLNITQRHDLFLYHTLHQTERPKDDGGSSGGSFHSSGNHTSGSF